MYAWENLPSLPIFLNFNQHFARINIDQHMDTKKPSTTRVECVKGDGEEIYCPSARSATLWERLFTVALCLYYNLVNKPACCFISNLFHELPSSLIVELICLLWIYTILIHQDLVLYFVFIFGINPKLMNKLIQNYRINKLFYTSLE